MIAREIEQELLARHGLQHAGAPLHRAIAIVVAIHGRGADARSILSLGEVLAQPNVTLLAPAAEHGAWYPRPFIAPVADNEPWLGRSLARLGTILDDLSAAGIPDRRLGLMGFSQGACLALEVAIIRPRAYGCVIGLSGGYIGPLDATPRRAVGSLKEAHVFIGCGDPDAHIPLERVRETTALMRAMGADVTERIYPGFGHGVNDDEIAQCRKLLVRMQDVSD
jgi:phospholipase/carboxylesterase